MFYNTILYRSIAYKRCVKHKNRHLICVLQAQADALDYHTSSSWTNVSTSTVSPKLKLSALMRDSIVRSRVNALKLHVTWLSCTEETIHSKWKNTEEGEESGFIGTCVKWGKEWHSTICREGVRFWTIDLFIHPLHLEQGEDTQVENFLELNVEKQSAPWGQIH